MTVLNEGTAAWVEELRQIDTTDPVLGGDSGPLNAQGKDLGRRTRWLKVLAEALRGGTTCVVPAPGIMLYAQDWEYDAAVSGGVWEQTNVNGAGLIRLLLPGLPAGLTVANVAVTLKGATGHGGLPVTKPVARLEQRYASQSSAGWAYLDSNTYTDPSAEVSAYQAAHLLECNQPFTVDANKRYSVRLTGETGTYSLVGLACHGILVTFA